MGTISPAGAGGWSTSQRLRISGGGPSEHLRGLLGARSPSLADGRRPPIYSSLHLRRGALDPRSHGLERCGHPRPHPDVRLSDRLVPPAGQWTMGGTAGHGRGCGLGRTPAGRAGLAGWAVARRSVLGPGKGQRFPGATVSWTDPGCCEEQQSSGGPTAGLDPQPPPPSPAALQQSCRKGPTRQLREPPGRLSDTHTT